MENVNTNLQNMPKIKLYHQEELDIVDKDTLGEDVNQELEYELDGSSDGFSSDEDNYQY